MADTNASGSLREQLLRDAFGDCLPLSHVDSVARRVMGDSLSSRQALLMKVIRSLIDEGLMVVGDIVGASDERVEPWNMSLDDAMSQIYDEYVGHHDDRNWVFRTWFALTDSGERVAEALEARAQARAQLLRDGLEGCLPLAHLHSVVSHLQTERSARQALMMDVVRSLLEDRLIVVGRIGGETVERVDPWEISLNDAMDRIYDEYVVHHDDQDWVFGIWFALTDSGERAAQALETKKSEG